MEHTMFKDLPENGSVEMYAVLRDAQEKEAKNGSTFLCLTLFDGKMEVKANMWRTTKEALGFDPKNAIVVIAMDTAPYNGKPGYTVKRIRPIDPDVDEINKRDFIPMINEDPEALFGQCMDLAYSLSNLGIVQVVTNLYEENKNQLLHWGAAKSVHHNIVGGLLWHSYCVAKCVSDTCETYPVMNRDIAVAGALLHDIGKICELDTDEFGASEYTVEGSLFGHLLTGVEIVKQMCEKVGLSQETTMQLTHIVASHHGKLEYGAIALPATPEALAVHLADMLDSRMYVFEKCLSDMAPGEFSERQLALDGARIYKPAE